MPGIITECNGYCIFCGKPTNIEHHLVFGNGRRELADQDGLKIPCCANCHTLGRNTEKIHGNSKAERMSKMMGQLVFESRIGSREEFRKRYGVSYL